MPQKMHDPKNDEQLPIEVVYFAKNLREARLTAEISQKALGEAIGASQGVISEYERGLRALSITTMAKLASAVDMPLWRMLRPD